MELKADETKLLDMYFQLYKEIQFSRKDQWTSIEPEAVPVECARLLKTILSCFNTFLIENFSEEKSTKDLAGEVTPEFKGKG